ncbi:MAG: hypothetical protein OCD02_07905 [Spirochaetaceae bacterium]
MLVLLLIFAIVKPMFKVETKWVLLSLSIGMILTIPSLFTIKLIGIIFIMAIPEPVPVLVYQIISALTEEGYKFIGIDKLLKIKHRAVYALFIGGGFALTETLYLSIGNPNLAVIRTVITLPLHLVTAVLLSKAVINKRYFLLATLIHISFNIIIR